MDYAVVISAIVLGLSVLATIAKFLDWFIHSDPKTMVRTTPLDAAAPGPRLHSAPHRDDQPISNGRRRC